MGRAADQKIGNGSVAFVRLAHEIVPRHQRTDEDALQRALRVEMPGETVDIVAQGGGEDFGSVPLIITRPGDAQGGHEIARRGNRKPGAAQHDKMAGFNAPQQACDIGWVENGHEIVTERRIGFSRTVARGPRRGLGRLQRSATG
jgi:hypothetical protein